jgi:hypothetical protein
MLPTQQAAPITQQAPAAKTVVGMLNTEKTAINLNTLVFI